ncbi:MAG: lactate racemase domain-containing protein [Gemmataceae bacterium]
MQVPIEYGATKTTLEIDPSRLIAIQRDSYPTPLSDPMAAVRQALESPRRYPALRRSLTPDDRVTIVVDDYVPQADRVLGLILDHITSAGVATDAITIVSTPGSPQKWIDELPDEFADVHLELHDPNDRKRLAYLATTKDGLRVYLNRTVVEADQLVIASAPRYGAGGVPLGAESLVFPSLSDAETRRKWSPDGSQRDNAEILWLLGAPFVVQVIAAANDGIAEVIGGSLDTLADGRAALRKYWQVTIPPVELAIASVSCGSTPIDTSDLAKATSAAAAIVRSAGRIIVLSDSAGDIGEGFQRMLATDDVATAIGALKKAPSLDAAAALDWLHSVRDCRVMLLSGLPSETVEGLFATPIEDIRQVQKLVDAGGSCAILPDAQRMSTLRAE